MQNKGCQESTTAYYQATPEVREMVEKAQRSIDDLKKNHTWIVWGITPAYTLASGQTAKFYLYKGFTLGVNPRQEMLFVEFNY